MLNALHIHLGSKLLRVAAVLTVAALLVAQRANAETPTPVQPTTPTPAAGQLRYIVQAFGPDPGQRAPDGTTISVERQLSRAEAENARRTGSTVNNGCAEVTVRNGTAELVAIPTPECPDGSRLLVWIDYHSGWPPITAEVIPPFEWRAAQAGEQPKQVVVRAKAPHTAGDAGAVGVTPPITGDVARSSASRSNVPDWRYAALATSIVLALVSVAVAMIARKRPAG